VLGSVHIHIAETFCVSLSCPFSPMFTFQDRFLYGVWHDRVARSPRELNPVSLTPSRLTPILANRSPAKWPLGQSKRGLQRHMWREVGV